MKITRIRNRDTDSIKIVVEQKNECTEYLIYPYKNGYSVYKEVGPSIHSLSPVVEGDWDGFASKMDAIRAIFEDVRLTRSE